MTGHVAKGISDWNYNYELLLKPLQISTYDAKEISAAQHDIPAHLANQYCRQDAPLEFVEDGNVSGDLPRLLSTEDGGHWFAKTKAGIVMCSGGVLFDPLRDEQGIGALSLQCYPYYGVLQNERSQIQIMCSKRYWELAQLKIALSKVNLVEKRFVL